MDGIAAAVSKVVAAVGDTAIQSLNSAWRYGVIEDVIHHGLLAGFPIGASKRNTPIGYLLEFATKALEKLSMALRLPRLFSSLYIAVEKPWS